jgi:TolB-like protein/Flp pilus assembly protein TadD
MGMALRPGEQLGPYEIVSPLGAGGMGEVYRARDPRLKRDVALKVLPAELASKPERLERFQREAETLAALNHPHIVTIFSVEEAEGLHFLTMELVEGQTLTKVIPRGGLPLPRLFRIAIPLTEAVSAAHEKGITHRDLKPGNVMVAEEDRIKVLDFGLAKLRHEPEAMEGSQSPTAAATDAGLVMGTAPYMSPEQVQGKAVDHRSDVFSLGIMLYEMVTGDRPFQGDTPAELASSILRDTPAAVTERKTDLPKDLARLIKHCLEKEPTRRFQSVLDLRNELEELRREVDSETALTAAGTPVIRHRAQASRRWMLVGGAIVATLALALGYVQMRSEPSRAGETTTSGPSPAAPERKMLVVLPFENLGAPEDAYFAAGMTEEITNRLARVSGLGVISRTSAVQYDRTGKTVKQIGADLGVAFVLEGTVRWSRRSEGAERVRISPQLIRVADDTHVWADSYDRVIDDIFAVQSDIAEEVVGQLGVTLLPEERRSLEARPTENLAAYQAYLRGLEHHWDPDLSTEGRQLAAQMLERAVALDPTFAAAHALLSEVHSALYFFGDDLRPERLAKARAAAERGLELAPDSPEGHRALGYYHYWGHLDYERALEEFGLAAKLLPNDSGIVTAIAYVHRRQGRFEEAVAGLKKAADLDPRNAQAALDLAETYDDLRRYAEAEPYYERSISLAPDQVRAYQSKATSYVSREGSLEKARATLERVPNVRPAEYALAWFWQEMRERDYQAALERLAGAPDPLYPLLPKSLLQGFVYMSMDHAQQAHPPCESARVSLVELVGKSPDRPVGHSSLAWAYACLGRKAEAIREAERAVELIPVSKDALSGPAMLWQLAGVYAWVGEHDAAIDQVEYLLSIPFDMSIWDLRLHPRWDPLRDHPRFQALVGEDWQHAASR